MHAIRSRLARLVVAMLVATGAVGTYIVAHSQSASAATVTLPDLKILVPTNQFSIGTNAANSHRQLQFTHQTLNAGSGPFAIQPTFNSRTGVSSFVQEIYRSPSPGQWVIDHARVVPVNGVFQAPSDYNFPLTRFTLNKLNGTALGVVVAVSPKVDYCITGDVYIGGVPNTPNSTSPPASNCTNPNGLLGLSVGWADQYDQTDNGQPIDLTGIADGTYVLHATVDPQHVFQESNVTNDITNTTISIAGNKVSVISQSSPSTPLPTVALSSPLPGAVVRGTVTLQSTAHAVSPASVQSVRYLLDGEALSGALNVAPYTFHWGTFLISGTRHLCAQVTDSNGTVNTSSISTVSVARTAMSGVSVDVNTSVTGHSAVTSAPFSTTVAHDVIMAFVGADGPNGSFQQVTVSGLGLTWHLVRRSNAQAGDAEIWSAVSTHLIHSGTVSSHERTNGFAQQLQVLALAGSAGLGHSGAASAATGPAKLTITTSAVGSFIFGVGSDWDNAVGRTLLTGQSMVRQWLDQGDGDAFWVQSTSNKSTSSGHSVSFGTSAPTNDRWNFAAIEIRPAVSSHLVASITSPAVHERLFGTVPVSFAVNDSVPISSWQLSFRGQRVASFTQRSASRTLKWDTRSFANGSSPLTLTVLDAFGKRTATQVEVNISNPSPAMTCFVLSSHVTLSGGHIVTTGPIHVGAPTERIIAFVRTSPGSVSGSTVRSRNMTWTRLRALHSANGDLAVWTSVVPRQRTIFQVTSRLLSGHQTVTVMAIEGTNTPVVLGVRHTAFSALHSSTMNSLIFVVGIQSGAKLVPKSPWFNLSLVTNAARHTATWVRFLNQPIATNVRTASLASMGALGTQLLSIVIALPGDDG